MSRKDFQLIAEAIAQSVNEAYEEGQGLNLASILAVNFGARLQALNPRFDSVRFYEAINKLITDSNEKVN